MKDIIVWPPFKEFYNLLYSKQKKNLKLIVICRDPYFSDFLNGSFQKNYSSSYYVDCGDGNAQIRFGMDSLVFSNIQALTNSAITKLNI